MSLLSIQVKRWQLPLFYVARKIVSQSIQVWKKGIPLLYSNVHYLVSVYESSSLKVDGISSFLHVFTSRQTWNRFVQECQHLRMESCLRSRNCTVCLVCESSLEIIHEIQSSNTELIGRPNTYAFCMIRQRIYNVVTCLYKRSRSGRTQGYARLYQDGLSIIPVPAAIRSFRAVHCFCRKLTWCFA